MMTTQEFMPLQLVPGCIPTVIAVPNMGREIIAGIFTTKNSSYREMFDRESVIWHSNEILFLFFGWNNEENALAQTD